MQDVFICDAVRTPFGRYGGSLATVRADDLGAVPIRALVERNPGVDWGAVDDVVYGCANQAGEDNRNVARMALLLAGLPQEVPGSTINRLCGSSMDAIGIAARAIKSGEAALMIAGGVESMTRAPFVMGKAESAFSRSAKIEDTTIGWRFINPLMKAKYGVDSMPETAENVAAEFKISRADQDAFALRSQQRTAAAIAAGRLAEEIVPVTIAQKKGDAAGGEQGRASAPNDARGARQAQGRCAPGRHGHGRQCVGRERRRLRRVARLGGCGAPLRLEAARARCVASATAGVAPRIMGFGPAPAMRKLLAKTGLKLADIDVIELNEAFAAQALAVLRDHGIADDAPYVNPNGGAIALGHPLGASGARLVTTALYELQRTRRPTCACVPCASASGRASRC